MSVTSSTGWFVTNLLCWPSHFISYFSIFRSLPSLCFHFFSIPPDGCLFSCSEALMGSQRTSVTLRNVACVPSLWLLSRKEETTLPRSQRRGFLFIEVRLMVPVDVGGRVRDIYIVQDHQLSGFYVLACILSIHWAMVYRPPKALNMRNCLLNTLSSEIYLTIR